MIGARMGNEAAKLAVGHTFAGRVNGGEWLVGRLIGYCAEPTVVIEVDSGKGDGIPVQRHIVLSTIKDWSSDVEDTLPKDGSV